MAASNLINLASTDGAKLLHDVQTGVHGSCFQPNLVAVFAKQTFASGCGLASSALVLSAHCLSQSKPSVTEQSMFDHPATQNVVTKQQMSTEGLTLVEVGALLKAHHCRVNVIHAADSSVQLFRQQCIDVLSRADSSSAVLVNYHMQTLGQEPIFGHHSPLAAYHADTDRLLVLDVWPETSECWAPVEKMFAAMNTVDSDSGKSRGYCIVEF